MQNFCTLPVLPKFPICKFPPCNCEKCTKLRSNGEQDQNDIKHSFAGINKEILKETTNIFQNDKNSLNIDNDASKIEKRNLFTIPNLTMPSWNFASSNLHSVLFDIVGIIAFFIMATFMFWITICQYLWHFAKIIFQSGRKVQLITMVLLLLLCISITFHAIKGKRYRPDKIQTIEIPSTLEPSLNNTIDHHEPKCHHSKPCLRKKCSRSHIPVPNQISNENLLTTKDDNKDNSNFNTSKRHCKNCAGSLNNLLSPSNSNLSDQKHPSLCDLCAKQIKPETSDFQPILSDEEIREMYNKFKLYSVPSEMKTPPSIGNVIEVLSGLYHGISSSIANTLP